MNHLMLQKRCDKAFIFAGKIFHSIFFQLPINIIHRRRNPPKKNRQQREQLLFISYWRVSLTYFKSMFHFILRLSTIYLKFIFSLNAGKYGLEQLRIPTLFTQCSVTQEAGNASEYQKALQSQGSYLGTESSRITKTYHWKTNLSLSKDFCSQ